MKTLFKTVQVLFLSVLLGPVNAGTAEQAVAYIAYTEGYWQAWVMAPDGTQQRQVTQSPYDKHRLSWYPDGKSLLVNGNQGELNRVNVSSGEETPVTLSLAGMNDAMVSPDGRRIAFSLSAAGTSDGNDIWVVNTDGSDLLKKTTMKWLQHEPAWSPDGKTIYFLSGDGKQSHNIWKLSLDSGQQEQLTDNALYHFDIAVSPAGDLAYSNNRTGNYDVWIKSDGEEPRQLTDHPGLDAKPAWAPDGSALLFESTRSGASNLWRISVQGKETVQVTDLKQGARAPVWFHGGEQRP